jgi:hypothetical protein
MALRAVLLLLAGSAAAAPPASTSSRLGLVVGTCLGIDNPSLQAGQEILGVDTDLPQKLVGIRVLRPRHDAWCIDPELTRGEARDTTRIESLEANGLSYYAVELFASPGAQLFLIAIADWDLPLRSNGAFIEAALNHDNTWQRFGECSGGEGEYFAAWSHFADHDQVLWRGYWPDGAAVETHCAVKEWKPLVLP